MKRTVLLVCLLAFCNLALFSQTAKRPRTVHTTQKSAIHVPPQEVPAGLTKIYSNLGKSKLDLYNDTTGWSEVGPGAGLGYFQFNGMPFTPKSNAHVSQVRVAVQYGGSGANQVNLSIYGDSNNDPGTLLAGPITVTNLSRFGTCCTLAIANFSTVAVTSGTQYWVVADTPLNGTGSDFLGSWDTVPVEVWQADNTGSGWSVHPGITEAAGEVLGTIP